MTNIQVTVSGAEAVAALEGQLTGGMVGVAAVFAFDESWESLEKTAIFRAGGESYCVREFEDVVTVPWEILRKTGCTLYVGVYGVSADGTQALPTLWATVGTIQAGADPEATESCDPSLPIWKQAIDKADAVYIAARDGEFDGYSPVRGVDYWTAADIAQIQGFVEDAILGGAW